MKYGYFITGTDTGVGKTLIASALLYQLGRQGLSTVGMKPVAAGCTESPSGLLNEDVEALRQAATLKFSTEEICPYLFSAAIAPHIAADEEGKRIELEKIEASFTHLAQRAEAIVVEGVGGFRVPLNERHDTADLAAMLRLPIIMVVGLRLGCLNHALLTADAIRARGLSLIGWIGNHIDPDMARVEQNIEALLQRLPCPLMGIVPFQRQPEPNHIAFKLPMPN
ncbi:MAG: dethiobiotin synthase [Pseudomonadota bacterium]